jgi:type I restriction enzyme S subunit
MNNSTNKLGDLVNFQNGYAFKSSDYSENGHYLIRIKNVQSGFIDINDKCFVNIPKLEKFNKFILKKGDILISLTGNVGRIARIDQNHLPAVLNQRVASVEPKDKTVLDPDYLYFLLQSPQFFDHAIKSGKGAAQQNISTGDLEKFEVFIPELRQQKITVESLRKILSDIEMAFEHVNIIQAKLDQLLQSRFDEVFDRLIKQFGLIEAKEVIDVRDGTHDSPKYTNSGYPLITSKNLINGLIDFSKISYISEFDFDQINKRSKVETGDLLFAMIGTIGNPVVVQQAPKFAIKNVALFKKSELYDMKFLSFYLRSRKVVDKFQREANGTTQKFLGLGYLRRLIIPNVTLTLQKEKVAELNSFEYEIEKLSRNFNYELDLWDKLKQSTLQYAYQQSEIKMS